MIVGQCPRCARDGEALTLTEHGRRCPVCVRQIDAVTRALADRPHCARCGRQAPSTVRRPAWTCRACLAAERRAS